MNITLDALFKAIPLIGAVAGIVSLYLHISRHIRERTSVSFVLAAETTPEAFKIYPVTVDHYGAVSADKTKWEIGLHMEFFFVNRSIHPISIYEVSIRHSPKNIMLLESSPRWHSRNHYMFKESILKLPIKINPFDSERRVLLFNLKDIRPHDIEVVFQTSRRTKRMKVTVHYPEDV